MKQSAARQGDRIVALDMHVIQPPPPSSTVVVPHPFSGIIDSGVSTNVTIGGSLAAVLGSRGTNAPPHIPIGGTFVIPPTNLGTIVSSSQSVTINGRGAARTGDDARTCDDNGRVAGKVVAAQTTVVIGD